MSEFNIQERQEKNSNGRKIAVLDCEGRITIGENSTKLRTTINELLKGGKRDLSILIDLGGVTHLDECGIGELVRSYSVIGQQQGRLKLLNLTNRIKDLLTITKLIIVFDCYDDLRTALESFR